MRKHIVVLLRAEQTLLLDAGHGVYYTLNRMAAEVLRLLESGAPRTTIVHHLHRTYDEPVARLEADVAAMIDRLVRLDLIEPDR